MDFSELPARQLGEAARAFLGNHGSARVEEEALWFYLGEHAVAEVRKRRKLHEKLTEEERAAVEHAFFHNNKIFLRMMFYVAMICVRETRHIKSKATLHTKVPAKLHAAMEMFGNIPDEATSAMHHFLNKVPLGLTTGDLLDAMSFCFHKGTWGHQYGGKKWGDVCDALRGAVHGKYSPATFCDLAFALQHNAGSIFNKQMFYDKYTSELKTILDVQRGGQIPRYVISEKTPHTTQEMREYVWALAFLGEEFQGAVDWQAVMDHGAMQDYQHKIAQKKDIQEAVQASAELAKLKGFGGTAVMVWPGANQAPAQTVLAVNREGLKAYQAASVIT